MPHVDSLATPCLLLDRDRLQRNIDRMRSRTAELGVGLRPHMKTAKSIDVARMVLDSPMQGITVSTLAEAAYFAEHGIRDILYAVAIAPSKLGRVAALRRDGTDIQVVVDSIEAAMKVADVGAHKVWIEIDCDGRRSGVAPADPALVGIAGALGPALAGVMTHAGGSYGCRSIEELELFAERERWAAVAAAEAIRSVGIDCPGVSVGSTPTMSAARDLIGVTEARPGVYMFMDLYQAGLGVCSIDDIAISVAATVIGHRSDGLVIDAGALALSLDRSTASQPVDMAYGMVCDVDGAPYRNVVVDRVTQEHGVVITETRLEIGSVVRILPNHACITAAAHPGYEVASGNRVLDRWERVNGW